MRVTSRGQVTIPREVRERLGFSPKTEVEFRVEGHALRLVKVAAKRGRSRFKLALKRLRGSANVQMSTDEILAYTRK